MFDNVKFWPYAGRSLKTFFSRDIDTKKGFQINIGGDTLCLQYERLMNLKRFWSCFSKPRFFTASFPGCKNLLIYNPRPQMNLIPGAWLIFMIHFRYAHPTPDFSCIRSAPWRKQFDKRLPREQYAFFASSAPHTGEADKNVQTGFSRWSAVCHRSFPLICGLLPLSFVGAKDDFSIDKVKVNFWKITSFKGMIRKFLNMVAVHIEGIRHPLICLFDTLFSIQCPFKFFIFFILNHRLACPHMETEVDCGPQTECWNFYRWTKKSIR
jgi:hypothetical protein